ncbi:GTP pyrophosphokinase [Advenella kashmirensis W13003]|uniref:GTP pyrophosphokinase n=1 Tax=Advenella kashmirensis W13003 TaxID=1424334 RepID=V8QQP7_9BURK|nr:GTP pyrophosphokinase [Advenella kashmirensis W13003]
MKTNDPAFTPDSLQDSAWMDAVCAGLDEAGRSMVEKAIDWCAPILQRAEIATGEPSIQHAKGVLRILSLLQLDAATLVAALVLAIPIDLEDESEVDRKDELISLFGLETFSLINGSRALLRIGAIARNASSRGRNESSDQREMLRKMLLAMASDLRIVLIRLASRLQTLRWYAETKNPCPIELAEETRDVYASLANRLGIWQIKWEMEDLSFRFLAPDTYKEIARKLEGRRIEREARIQALSDEIAASLAEMGVQAEVSGRAKHIYSIYNKMRNKHLSFDQLYDLLAIRIIVASERDCYATLSLLQARWTPVMNEFDDYIARPKPNGYRSLHTVLKTADGHNFEAQIRTRKMHDFAEYGMAAHWRYKEAGPKGGQVAAVSMYDRQVSWMRQLLAWRKEVGLPATDLTDEMVAASGKDSAAVLAAPEPKVAQTRQSRQHKKSSERIYVLTPQARVIELPEGATPVDFAYHLHTDLGHRCRGARVDGQMVALNTKLLNGQTVEIIAAKSGGPSRDWINTQLGYLASPRARAKVRLWFNAIELQKRITTGQDMVEKELARLGKSAVNLEQLAERLGFANSDDLYVAAAKDEFSLRQIATVFQEPEADPAAAYDTIVARESAAQSAVKTGKSGVLVVGVDSLLTQLARCCHPAPPDPISGFVTRGRGVSIHRSDCPSFAVMKNKNPERVIDVTWGDTGETVYPVNIAIHSQDRAGLLKDLTELFSRMKLNVVGVNTQSKASIAHLHFTVEVRDGEQLRKAMNAILDIPGIISAARC